MLFQRVFAFSESSSSFALCPVKSVSSSVVVSLTSLSKWLSRTQCVLLLLQCYVPSFGCDGLSALDLCCVYCVVYLLLKLVLSS